MNAYCKQGDVIITSEVSNSPHPLYLASQFGQSLCWGRRIDGHEGRTSAASASSARAALDGRIASERSANALFVIQRCVCIVHAPALHPPLVQTWNGNNKTQECAQSFICSEFPPTHATSTATSFFVLCGDVSALAFAAVFFPADAKTLWIVDVFQGARVQNSAKNLGVRDRTPSSVPR